MKNNSKIVAICILAMTLSLGSCTQRLIDFTVISSKNVSLKVDKGRGKQVRGKSFGFLMLGANIKDAIDKALQSAGPDYDMLIDGVVRLSQYPFYGGYTVEGTAVRTSEIKAMLGEEGFKEWSKNHRIVTPENADVILEN